MPDTLMNGIWITPKYKINDRVIYKNETYQVTSFWSTIDSDRLVITYYVLTTPNASRINLAIENDLELAPPETEIPPDIDKIAQNLQIVSTLTENQKLKTRIAVLESEYQKLANLVADWYLAPEDTGFSEETLALQNKAKWLSETPVSAWLP